MSAFLQAKLQMLWLLQLHISEYIPVVALSEGSLAELENLLLAHVDLPGSFVLLQDLVNENLLVGTLHSPVSPEVTLLLLLLQVLQFPLLRDILVHGHPDARSHLVLVLEFLLQGFQPFLQLLVQLLQSLMLQLLLLRVLLTTDHLIIL